MEGQSAYLNTLPLEQAKAYIAHERERQAGWKFLLDLKAHQRVLLVTPAGGQVSLSLSKHYQELVVLQANPVCEAGQRESGVTSSRAIFVHSSLAHPFPFADSTFDSVIFHNIGALLNRAGVNEDRLFAEGSRVVNEDGTLVVTGENTSLMLRILSGWFFLKTKVRGIKRSPLYRPLSFGFKSAEHLVNCLGFKQREAFALAPRLVSFSSVTPMVRPDSEILRKSVAWWERWQSPAYLIVSRRGGVPDSFLSQFAKSVLEQYSGGGLVRIKRYLTGNPNVVIIIAFAGDNRQGGMVARLPLTSMSLARCQKNWDTLQILSSKKGVLSEKVPRALGSGEFMGQPYFIESFVPGLVLTDPKPAALRRGMREAVPLLIAFHQASAVRRVVDEPVFHKMAAPFFDRLSPCLKREETRKQFQYLSDFLRERLLGRPLPFVYSHGDWQVENMVFDPATFYVRGVLDWDLFESDGLPLLDLLYLFLYTETLASGGGFEEIFCRRFIALRFDHEEQAALERYQSAVGVMPDQVLPLLVFLWLHHVVFRLEPIWRHLDQWMQTVFDPVLSGVCEAIRRDKG